MLICFRNAPKIGHSSHVVTLDVRPQLLDALSALRDRVAAARFPLPLPGAPRARAEPRRTARAARRLPGAPAEGARSAAAGRGRRFHRRRQVHPRQLPCRAPGQRGRRAAAHDPDAGAGVPSGGPPLVQRDAGAARAHAASGCPIRETGGDDLLLPGTQDAARACCASRPPTRCRAGLALLDAPDIDSLVADNRVLAAELICAADIWVMVTTAARYADAVPWHLLRTAKEYDATLVTVLDRVPHQVVVRGVAGSTAPCSPRPVSATYPASPCPSCPSRPGAAGCCRAPPSPPLRDLAHPLRPGPGRPAAGRTAVRPTGVLDSLEPGCPNWPAPPPPSTPPRCGSPAPSRTRTTASTRACEARSQAGAVLAGDALKQLARLPRPAARRPAGRPRGEPGRAAAHRHAPPTSASTRPGAATPRRRPAGGARRPGRRRPASRRADREGRTALAARAERFAEEAVPPRPRNAGADPRTSPPCSPPRCSAAAGRGPPGSGSPRPSAPTAALRLRDRRARLLAELVDRVLRHRTRTPARAARRPRRHAGPQADADRRAVRTAEGVRIRRR